MEDKTKLNKSWQRNREQKELQRKSLATEKEKYKLMETERREKNKDSGKKTDKEINLHIKVK